MRFLLTTLACFVLWVAMCVSGRAAEDEPDLPKGGETERAIRVAGGDWIVYRYHGSSDSGCRVTRMDAKLTEVRWRVQCESLGVPHTKYRHHIDVDVINDKVKVVSKGSGGEWEEILSLETGKQESRKSSLDR